MPVERTGAYPRQLSNLIQTHVWAHLRERLLRDLQNPLTILQSIRTALSRDGLSFGHGRPVPFRHEREIMQPEKSSGYLLNGDVLRLAILSANGLNCNSR